MKHFWPVAGSAAIAGCLLLVLVLITIKRYSPPGEELRHSLWSAGAISNRSDNDIWIECGAVSRRVVAIYRDYDGDGLVDECLMFSGPHVEVFRASNKDGLLDLVRDIRQPLDSVERLPRGSPEAGPFTRAKLDEEVRTHPIHAPSDDAGR
jgi:hypothetical protein